MTCAYFNGIGFRGPPQTGAVLLFLAKAIVASDGAVLLFLADKSQRQTLATSRTPTMPRANRLTDMGRARGTVAGRGGE